MINTNAAIEQYEKGGFVRSKKLEKNTAVKYAYAYSNENLRAYIDLLNLKGGRVATVGSSGDQAFYAVFKGAEDVIVMDVNAYTKPIIELKSAAIKRLEYKDFMNYWTIRNMFDKDIYNRFIMDVSDETREFLHLLQDKKRVYGSFDVTTDVVDQYSVCPPLVSFHKDVRPTYAVGCEFYDNERTFDILKNKLMNANIEVRMAEYDDFPKVLDGKFDTIMLSNIHSYKEREPFFDVLHTLRECNMKKGGTIQTHYEFWRTREFGEESKMFKSPGGDECMAKPYVVDSVKEFCNNLTPFDEFRQRKASEMQYGQELTSTDNLVYIERI